MDKEDSAAIAQLLSSRNKFRRIRGLGQFEILAKEHRNNPAELDALFNVFKQAHMNNPTLIDDCIEIKDKAFWENHGLRLCLYSQSFVEFFPTIKRERDLWTVLDHLQYEIIKYNYYSDANPDDQYDKSKQAMSFLLEHRLDEPNLLINAARRDERVDEKLLSHFNEALAIYSNKQNTISNLPKRTDDNTLNLTSETSIKVKDINDMITVAPKEGGASPGRIKVKRIKSTQGKASEVDKYLNLWIEKDLIEKPENQYDEPTGGSLANSFYPEGTPKARMLLIGYNTYSSINKFQRKLILGKNICAQPNFNPSERGLLGYPVVGLISLAITSNVVINNTDFKDENFGVFLDNDRMRFFLFDFDLIDLRPSRTLQDNLIFNALNSDNISNVSENINNIKTQIEDQVTSTFGCNYDLIDTMTRLINDYDENAFIQELKDIVNYGVIFLNSKSSNISTLLPRHYTPTIRPRVDRLCKAINSFIALYEQKNTPIPKNV